MMHYLCPRCDKHGIHAEGFRHCTKCRDALQGANQQKKKGAEPVQKLIPADPEHVRSTVDNIKAMLDE